jgi:ribosomal protein L44E
VSGLYQREGSDLKRKKKKIGNRRRGVQIRLNKIEDKVEYSYCAAQCSESSQHIRGRGHG